MPERQESSGLVPDRQEQVDTTEDAETGLAPADGEQGCDQLGGNDEASPGASVPGQEESLVPEVDQHAPPTQPNGADRAPVPEDVGDEDIEYVSVEFDGMD